MPSSRRFVEDKLEIFDFHYQTNPNIEFIATKRCATVIAPLHSAIGGMRASRPTKFVCISTDCQWQPLRRETYNCALCILHCALSRQILIKKTPHTVCGDRAVRGRKLCMGIYNCFLVCNHEKYIRGSCYQPCSTEGTKTFII